MTKLLNYREVIKDYVKQLGYEIIEEIITDDIWILAIQTDQLIMTIQKKKEWRFWIVYLDSEKINLEITAEQNLKLMSILYTQTAKTLLQGENNCLHSFNVHKKIFPECSEFSIKDLEEAIIAVENTIRLGYVYLNSISGNVVSLKTSEDLRKIDPIVGYH